MAKPIRVTTTDAHLKSVMDARAVEYSRGKRLLTAKSHYWTESSLPFVYAFAVTQIVWTHGRAAAPYQQAVEAWRRPDCVKWAEQIAGIFDDWDGHKQRIAQMARIYAITGEVVFPDVLPFDTALYEKSADVEYLIGCLGKFIRVGFNRKRDQDDEAWKVVPSTETPLFQAVGVWTLAEAMGVNMADWAKWHGSLNGKPVDEIMTTEREQTNRIRRRILSVIKPHVKLVHDKKLLDYAAEWFGCRVSPGSIEQYVDECASNDDYIDRSNVENAIAPYDDATGYPRKWRR